MSTPPLQVRISCAPSTRIDKSEHCRRKDFSTEVQREVDSCCAQNVNPARIERTTLRMSLLESHALPLCQGFSRGAPRSDPHVIRSGHHLFHHHASPLARTRRLPFLCPPTTACRYTNTSKCTYTRTKRTGEYLASPHDTAAERPSTFELMN